jgi:hypothetical protein
VVWTLFDTIEPDLSRLYETDPHWKVDAENWSHLNHLHYEPDEDAYYVTSRNLRQVYRIDRATGVASWVLSEGGGDFDPGDTEVTLYPHSAEPTEDGVLLFDTSHVPSGGCSAMSEFALDLDAWTIAPSWLYYTEDCQYSWFFGNATELDNGNRMMVLATSGQIDEVNPDGELVSRLTSTSDLAYGFASWEASLYP